MTSIEWRENLLRRNRLGRYYIGQLDIVKVLKEYKNRFKIVGHHGNYTSAPSNTINNNLQSRIFYNDDNTNITNNE